MPGSKQWQQELVQGGSTTVDSVALLQVSVRVRVGYPQPVGKVGSDMGTGADDLRCSRTCRTALTETMLLARSSAEAVWVAPASQPASKPEGEPREVDGRPRLSLMMPATFHLFFSFPFHSCICLLPAPLHSPSPRIASRGRRCDADHSLVVYRERRAHPSASSFGRVGYQDTRARTPASAQIPSPVAVQCPTDRACGDSLVLVWLCLLLASSNSHTVPHTYLSTQPAGQVSQSTTHSCS